MGRPIAHAPVLPRRSWRRWWPWVIGVGVTVLVIAASWTWFVPPAAEAVLRSWLRQQCGGDVLIESVDVGLGHLVARHLELGAAAPGTGKLTVAAVTAEFSLTDLWAQRVDTLVLDSPTWTMAEVPGRASSPFEDLMRRTTEAPAPRTSRALPALPVRRVVLRGGRIEPPPGSAIAAVTFDGTWTVDDGRWEIDLVASTGTQRIQAKASLQQLPLSEPPQAGGSVALRIAGPEPLEFDGGCELRATAEGRALMLDLRRRPGAFELTVADVTCSGDGDIEVHASLPFARLADAVVEVRAEGLGFSSAMGLQIRGLASRMHLQGLPVPISLGPQLVSWRSAQFGEIPVGSGDATFDLRAGPELQLQLRQRTADDIGSVEVQNLRLARGQPTSATTLVFDQVPLRGCLEELSRGRITGEGRLSGTLTLQVQVEPRFAIELRDGLLAAAPGGVVRFLDDADTEALVRQHAQGIAGSPGQDAQVHERLVAALQEFGFTTLEFRIVSEREGVTLRVHADGAGQQVPQHLNLDINVHGFDTMVDTAISIKLGLDRAKRGLSDRIGEHAQSLRMQRKP